MAVSFLLILFFGKRLAPGPPPRSASSPCRSASCSRSSSPASGSTGSNHPPTVPRSPPTSRRPTASRRRRRGDRVRDRLGHRGLGETVPAEDGTLRGVRALRGEGEPPPAPPRASPPPSCCRTGRATSVRRGRGRARRRARVRAPVVRTVTWFTIGGIDFEVGTLLDGLAVMMLVIVTLISLLVHIYSTEYVHGDRALHALLRLPVACSPPRCSSSCCAQNTLQMLVGWELVGVCSFVLIGHWWEEKPNTDAALKAFLTNRVGDIGLHHRRDHPLLRRRRSSFDILRHQRSCAIERRDQPHAAARRRRCCLIAGVMSKSGQFPLHTWLPDAMAGPTPVSALIHAATMVVAGVYLVARLYPCSSRASSIGTARVQPTSPSSAASPSLIGGAAGLRAERHQEGARVLHDQPARLHGDGPRRRRLDRGRVPPLHPRLLQGLPLPRRRLGEPRLPPHAST